MDRLNPKEPEAKQVYDWVSKIAETGYVGEMDPMLLRSVLAECGANFEISEEVRLSLAKYSNFNKRPGMNAVWGETKVDEIKSWIAEEFIPGVEKKFGREFPDLYDPKTGKYDARATTNYSGSLQFFGELTSYAAGVENFDDFKRRTERRALKGKLWAEGQYEPSKNHPFPPGLPKATIEKIFSWKK